MKVYCLETPKKKLVDVGGQVLVFRSKEQAIIQFPWHKKFIKPYKLVTAVKVKQ